MINLVFIEVGGGVNAYVRKIICNIIAGFGGAE